jgi:hypothetical protein
VLLAKRALIDTNKLMVYRFEAAWDQFRPQSQSRSLAWAMGLAPAPNAAGQRHRSVVCSLPRATIAALAQTAEFAHREKPVDSGANRR